MTTDFGLRVQLFEFLRGQKGLMASLGNNNWNKTSVRRQGANILVATSVTSSSVCSPSGVHYLVVRLHSYQFFSISFVGVVSKNNCFVVGLRRQFGEFDMHEYVLTCRTCTVSYVGCLIRAMKIGLSRALESVSVHMWKLAGSLFAMEIFHISAVVETYHSPFWHERVRWEIHTSN